MSEKKFYDKQLFNQILLETENFAVMPTLGSIVEGWLLIIPKKHYVSFGYMTNLCLFDELSALLSQIEMIVKETYGDFIIFENGAFCANSMVGCGVDYAHIHIVPTNLNLPKTVEDQFDLKYSWKQIEDLKESIFYIKEGLPYLYYRDQQKQSFITTCDNIPSQLFRKAIASSVGLIDKYDWKKEPFLDNIEKTIRNYRKHFQVLV